MTYSREGYSVKHESLFIDISESVEHNAEAVARTFDMQAAQRIRTTIVNFLREQGDICLEDQTANIFRKFFDPEDTSIRAAVLEESRSLVYVSCLRRGGAVYFVDIESRETHPGTIDFVLAVEIDLFAPDINVMKNAKNSIIEDIMKCFGLTKAKDVLVAFASRFSPLSEMLRNMLTLTEPLSEGVLQCMRQEKERSVLRELKKRGSILERDLDELVLPSMTSTSTKNALDYLSGEEYKLVERKYAIICRDTDEIIFLARSKNDLESVMHVECAKCSKRLKEELIMGYYGVTETLRNLLDGNRWMPLFIRDALIKSGVPSEGIFTEAKHGEDEIDVIACYRDRIIIIEAKNRPVSLNDAYKLSAKTSRLEAVFTKQMMKEKYGDDDLSQYIYANTLLFEQSKVPFIPMIVSTNDIAKDARELLAQTKDSSVFLENCDGQIDPFIGTFIHNIDQIELRRRLENLLSVETDDSLGRLIQNQLQQATALWTK